jgi:hypothetical protein
MPLQLFQTIERRPATILELGDHRRSRFVVLLRADPFWLFSREDLPAGSTAQSFQRVDRGCQRRLSHDPHEHLGLLLPVDVAFPTLRAAIAVFQVLMRNVHLLRSSEGIGSVAPVPGLRFVFGLLRAIFRLTLRRGIRRCRTSLGEHVLGLLRASWQQQLP